MTFLFQHPERLWITLVVIAVGGGMLWFGYRHSPLARGRRMTAQLCKLMALALLALCLADPRWTRQQPKRGANELAVVADTSASLDLAETAGGPTRAAALRRALGSGDEEPVWMRELGELFRVKTLVADERLRSVADFDSLDFRGRRSDLAGALQALERGAAGRALAATVLFTDGNATDTWPQEKPSRPVFPVLVGSLAPTPDLAIQEVSVSQTAFEDSPVVLTVTWSAAGFDNREIAVAVLDDEGRVLASEKLRAGATSPQPVARLKVPVAKPGICFLRVGLMEASLLAKTGRDEWRGLLNETVRVNNERLIAIDRGQGPYRVLYVSGRPNWEYKFLRRALAGDPEVQLPSLVRIAKREPKFEWRGRVGESSNPLFRGFGDQASAQRYDQPVLIRLGTKDAKELAEGFPKSADALFGEYRAVVLDDLEAEFFTQEQMNLLERFVAERGGALLMLGGQESFQAGGYEHTPIGRLLPVHLDRIGAVEPMRNGRLDLSREGWLEPWTRLRAGQDEEERRLAAMPGFYSVNPVLSVKPGASVLATVATTHATHPALVAQRFGEGRSVALTVGDIWRWGLGDAAAMKDQERFWRQLMRWLVVDVPDRVELAVLPRTASVQLAVRVREADFRPMDDALVAFEVAGPGGAKVRLPAEPSLSEAGLFEAEFFPKEAGAWRVQATVTRAADETLPAFDAVKQSGWAWQPEVKEWARLEPDRAGLQKLAEASGGRLLELGEVGQLPELLRAIEVPVQEVISRPLWHAPWAFALLLGLLGAEWWLRRKGGLA